MPTGTSLVRRAAWGVAATALAWAAAGCGSSAPTTGASSATTAAGQQAANQAAAAAGCPSNPATALHKPSWKSPPAMTINATGAYQATIKTDVGQIVIALDPSTAPMTVNNFVFLAQNHFYDCVIFHRVIPGFVDQTGDPTGTGQGGPGYEFADELPKAASPQYPLGSVAMANAGPNTNGSQFFIVTGAQGEGLPPDYTLFGHVTSGMSVADAINADGAPSGTPRIVHRMLSVTISS